MAGFASPAAAAEASVTVDVSPSSPRVGEDVTVSGAVTDTDGQPVAGATLNASRRDSSGTEPLVVDMTDQAGHYSFTDTPDVRGSVTWTVTWQRGVDDDVNGHQTVTVRGLPSSLDLDVSNRTVRTGAGVTLTAHLNSDSTDRTVSIYAKPAGQSRRLVDKGEAGPSGDFRASADVDRTTTFIARFDGDDTYEPASARRLVRARGRVDDDLRGYYDTAHGYRLFHVGSDATVVAHLVPELADECLYFRAQRHYGGAWHTTAVSPCVRTDAQGRESSKLKGEYVQVDKPYRVRAEWRGSPAALADKGGWLKLRFRG
jgi:hypothetical protein